MNDAIAEWAAQYEVIVLEGCDGVGKTTVAARLAARYGYFVLHSSRTPDGEDLVKRYIAMLAMPGRLVLDRSFVSELVYGPLRHGRSRLSFADAATLASIVAARGGVFVLLTSYPSQIAARLLARDNNAPTLAEISVLLDSYTSIFDRLASYAHVIVADAVSAIA
jgi:thymidylate kinase